VLIGYLAGAWVKRAPVAGRVTARLALAGIALLLLGWLWDMVFPINKALWTSSYVVCAAGWSLLLFALCYELMEVRGLRRLGRPLQILGVNAIFLFFASGIAARLLLALRAADGRSVYQWLYDVLFVPWAGSLNGSLAFAVMTVAVWWLALYGLYRRGWFFRL
jgi:predicted acyltransferase